MSRAKKELTRRKLENILSAIEDEEFVLLVWAIDALQSGREKVAPHFIRYPPEAATTELSSGYFLYKWSLEDLINELLIIPKRVIRNRTVKVMNFKHYDGAALAVNAVRKWQEAADQQGLRDDPFLELHRLGHKQIEWQHAFLSVSQLYRAAFVYGGPASADYFRGKYGLQIPDFMHLGFALASYYKSYPVFHREKSHINLRGITNEISDLGLKLLSADNGQARREAGELRGNSAHPSYRPSILRKYPCLAFGKNGERVYTPLVELLHWRFTSGLYYDLVQGGSAVSNSIGSRFEAYCLELLQGFYGAQATGAYKFKLRKQEIDTPDMFLRAEDASVLAIIECKAKKMTFPARFGQDPIAEAEAAFEEVVKAVLQIRRFASYSRRGLVTDKLDQKVIGVVLTLDRWFGGPPKVLQQIMERAKTKAEASADITEIDEVPIVFGAIDDFEQTLSLARSLDAFVCTLRAATTEDFFGWQLLDVHTKLHGAAEEEGPYPLASKISELLPWWDNYGRSAA
jgi:hypothetical protein